MIGKCEKVSVCRIKNPINFVIFILLMMTKNQAEKIFKKFFGHAKFYDEQWHIIAHLQLNFLFNRHNFLIDHF
jgi:hypothetical protein